MNMKSLTESKVFWLALAQAVIAVVTIFSSSYPDAHWVGVALLAKSIVDMWLRTQTSMPINGVLPQG